MVNLFIVFLLGIIILAAIVATAVSSRIRNNSTDLLSDFDRMYYQQQSR